MIAAPQCLLICAVGTTSSTHLNEVGVLTTSIQQVKDDATNALDQLKGDVGASLPPLGAVIAWFPNFSETKVIPSGWMRCNGSIIDVGPFSGQATPDLNNQMLFLRGGDDDLAGQTQEDALEDHIHYDEGHSHTDSGHSHEDTGHFHTYDVYDGYLHRKDDGDFNMCREDCNNLFYPMAYSQKTPYSKAKLTTNEANIQKNTSGIIGVDSGRVADETRPKNMRVVYIMRIF